MPLNNSPFTLSSLGGRHALLVAAALAVLLVVRPAEAGGGPENVFLLVNANSDSSKTIANYYIKLRNIPASNVYYVAWKGSLEIVTGRGFRDNILMPALQEIAKRGLGPQIDYLVYSSDFPWRIDFKDVFPPDTQFKAEFPPFGSLTGATYLATMLVGPQPDPEICLPASNWYVPTLNVQNLLRCQSLGNVPSRGFHFRYFWSPTGELAKNPLEGRRYFLSTMLGVTSGRGNTVDEVISYLRRAASADGQRPRGTIYYMWNNDVRSTTRHACYESVAAEINRLGVQARVLQGKIPEDSPDIMGLMAGTPTFDFKASQSTILPGAICEHLTSAGGVMSSKGSQTPLTEFLKNGAAGASGTVIEPLALQAKFPLPSLHLHYARGCSLAESFYQAVSGPYQLLIVGDPLCQPWAVIPQVRVSGVTAGQEVKGMLTLNPLATTAAGHRVGNFDLFVDGRLVAARSPPNQALALDTTKLSDGYHEVRIVGVQEDSIETQGRVIMPIVINNHETKIEFNVDPPNKVASTGKIRVSVRQPGATEIVIRQNSRELARVKGEAGDVEIDAALLGKGPIALQAFSEGTVAAVSKLVLLQVE